MAPAPKKKAKPKRATKKKPEAVSDEIQRLRRQLEMEEALEIVRSKTLRWTTSAELADTSALLFQQLKRLGILTLRTSLGIFDDANDAIELWLTSATDGEGVVKVLDYVNMHIHPVFENQLQARRKKKPFAVSTLRGKEVKDYYQNMSTYLSLPKHKTYNEVEHFYSFFFNEGSINIIVDKELAEEECEIMIRFANVFGLIYTRFLDLQKAEAQAHEAQVEAALERVRSRAMAMRASVELMDVADVLREQMALLGQPELETAAVHLYEEDPDVIHSWRAFRLGTNAKGQVTKGFMKIPKDSCAVVREWMENFGKGLPEYTIEVSGEKQDEWYDKVLFVIAPDIKEALWKSRHEPRFYHFTPFSGGALLMVAVSQPSEETAYLQRRAAVVFDLAYRRFLDLRNAEAQAREAQIELALERVRARTMAMHKSNELAETVSLLFKQLLVLGIQSTQIRTCGIVTFKHNEPLGETWITETTGEINPNASLIRFDEAPAYKAIYSSWKAGEKFLVVDLAGEALLEHVSFLKKYQVPMNDEVAKQNRATEIHIHALFFSSGYLFIISYESLPSFHALFKRFGSVFEQSYTRFLDLQKAEAQAREAQIEASLERVRSRSLAMHKSEELKEVIQVLYNQFIQLGILVEHTGFIIDYKEKDDMHIWLADQFASPVKVTIPYFPSPHWNSFIEAKTKGINFFTNLLSFEEKNRFYHDLFALIPGLPKQSQQAILQKPGLAISTVLLDTVGLYIENLSGTPYTDKDNSTLMRFGKVFQQSYTRFLDLQKAEAQAREAQIEAALERVRSKTMAMHNSEDVGTTVAVMFDELVKLGIETNRCGILIFGEGNDTEVWTAKSSPDRQPSLIVGHLDVSIHPLLQEVKQAWISKQDSFVYELSGDNIKMYYRAINNHPGYPTQFDLQTIPALEIHNDYFFQEGAIFAFTSGSVPEESAKIFKRFAGVFGQTYRRYLDLQQAESQAREARLEASLERVRGKAMGMHNSGDLTSTIKVFYQELESLHLKPLRCGVGLLNRNNRLVELSTISQGADGMIVESTVSLVMEGHPVLEQIHQNYLKQQEFHPVLRGNEIKKYNQAIRPRVDFPDFPEDAVTYGHFFYVEDYGVYAWTDKELSEDELKVYRRFTSVLTLTYKRYRELKDAEERARIAVRDASLDRVRAEIASMRHADDLQRITPLVWRELRTLGVPFFRCGVLIVNEQDQKADYYLSTPEGQPLAALHLDFNTKLSVVQAALQHWREQKVYIDHWTKEQFIAFARSMMELGQIQTMKSYQGGDQPPEEITLQFVPFMQGMLYVGSKDPLLTEQIELMKALAGSFSTAYARYEDFTRLEAAKAQVENTLKDLRTTQTQLVQSEKMASLGELTAGIAHEIQNPLNFVNNFSEVSRELLDEMEEELKKGNAEDAKQIARDVIENLEKINFHGKRADGIVKSMLQHSRKSTGQKELTDINALCDEYLRLSFHGLRAKDKSFNAKFETNLDPSLPAIAVLPQEIGRVVLNLINNAFYAVNERKRANAEGYEPTVRVTTKKIGNQVGITISDNGTGIPEAVIEKIFQPFFTTKPTGQGTGLGLSLAYDIVTKGHGGELRVKSSVGEGATFTIQLNANA